MGAKEILKLMIDVLLRGLGTIFLILCLLKEFGL